MNQKLGGILLCMMFFGASMSVISAQLPEHTIDGRVKSFDQKLLLFPSEDVDLEGIGEVDLDIPNPKGDMVDQFMVETEYLSFDPEYPVYGLIITGPYQMAQSFVPTFPTLTRIKLLLWKHDNPTFPIQISIRENLGDDDLVSVIKSPMEIPMYEELSLVNIDFQDIPVVPGNTYYIVVQALGGGFPGPMYAWAFSEGDPYVHGEGLAGGDDTWIPAYGLDTDFVFITYGLKSDDFLDQSQTIDSGFDSFIIDETRSLGQTVCTGVSVLTKLSLKLFKNGNPNQDLLVSIRKSLKSGTLVTMHISPDELSETSEWITLDIPDIELEGSIIYIILHTETLFGTMQDSYGWSYAKPSDLFEKAWFLKDGLWYSNKNLDFCFETYGIK